MGILKVAGSEKVAGRMTESYIQQQCFIYFTNNFCLKHHNPRCIMFSVPNEGENAYEIKRKRRIGLTPGASDMIMVVPGRTLYIELKTPEGRQSPAQIEFQARVEALGHEYHVIRSLDQFKELCRKLF